MEIKLRRALGWLLLLGAFCFLALVLPGLAGIADPMRTGDAPSAHGDWRDRWGGLLLLLWFGSFTWAGYRLAKHGSSTWLLSFVGLLLYLCAVIVIFATVPHLQYQGAWWPFAGLCYVFYAVPMIQFADLLSPGGNRTSPSEP